MTVGTLSSDLKEIAPYIDSIVSIGVLQIPESVTTMEYAEGFDLIDKNIESITWDFVPVDKRYNKALMLFTLNNGTELLFISTLPGSVLDNLEITKNVIEQLIKFKRVTDLDDRLLNTIITGVMLSLGKGDRVYYISSIAEIVKKYFSRTWR